MPEQSNSNENMLRSGFFLYRGRIPVHYRISGHGPARIVFLHGFASAHDTWLDMAKLFPADRYTLYLLDLKGFGRSAKPRDDAYTIRDQADLVASFIRDQGLRQTVLAGHSLGGAIALRVCLDLKEGASDFSVEKLILMDCAAYPQRIPKFFRRLRSPLIGPLFLRLMPARVLVRQMLEKVFFDPGTITPERFERFRGYLKGKGVSYVLRTTVKGIDPAEYVNVSDSYRTLTLPVLIIWGEEDRIIRVKNAYRLHGDLPGSKLKIIGKCGHNPQEERPMETFGYIAAFLE